jgi:hypothetical protein
LRAPAIGEFASPSDSSASMRARLPGRLEHAVHRIGVRDAHAMRIPALVALLLEDRLHLGTAPVHHHELDAEAVEQVQIVDHAEERFVRHDLAAEGDDERLVAERVDVRRSRTDPVHERPHGGGVCGGRFVGRACHRVGGLGARGL